MSELLNNEMNINVPEGFRILTGEDLAKYRAAEGTVNFGMILLMLGMLGEYIGRIFMNLNHLPQYVIKEKRNTDALVNEYTEVEECTKK